MSMHYRVNRRCCELSHNAVGLVVSVRLLTIASSVPSRRRESGVCSGSSLFS